MRELDDPDAAGEAAVVTMDAVLAELQSDSVNFLKCDVEGRSGLFELDADWIARVGLMSVECHSPVTPEELVGLLRASGGTIELHRESAPELGCETVLVRTAAT